MATSRITVRWNRGGAYDGEIRRVRLINAETMREAGLYLAVQVENRTLRGRDEAGNRFKPYSAAYAAAKGVPRGQVDLRRSGEMFRQFGVTRYTRNSVRIGFHSAEMEDRARYNEGMGRKFLGLDPRWLHDVYRRLQARVGFFGR